MDWILEKALFSMPVPTFRLPIRLHKFLGTYVVRAMKTNPDGALSPDKDTVDFGERENPLWF